MKNQSASIVVLNYWNALIIGSCYTHAKTSISQSVSDVWHYHASCWPRVSTCTQDSNLTSPPCSMLFWSVLARNDRCTTYFIINRNSVWNLEDSLSHSPPSALTEGKGQSPPKGPWGTNEKHVLPKTVLEEKRNTWVLSLDHCMGLSQPKGALPSLL